MHKKRIRKCVLLNLIPLWLEKMLMKSEQIYLELMDRNFHLKQVSLPGKYKVLVPKIKTDSLTHSQCEAPVCINIHVYL